MTCVVGNKCDLQDGRQVETSAAEDYADSIDSLFFETSALKNTGMKFFICRLGQNFLLVDLQTLLL